MRTKLLKMSRRLWANDMVSDELNRANRLKWIRAVRVVGDKWVVIQQAQRKS